METSLPSPPALATHHRLPPVLTSLDAGRLQAKAADGKAPGGKPRRARCVGAEGGHYAALPRRNGNGRGCGGERARNAPPPRRALA